MSLRLTTPCDCDGICPYMFNDGDYVNCEYWCGAEEPQDNPEEWEEDSFDDEEDRGSYGEFSYFTETEDDFYGSDYEY